MRCTGVKEREESSRQALDLEKRMRLSEER